MPSHSLSMKLSDPKHDAWVRKNFPSIRGIVYFASSGRAPMPLCTIRAIHSILRRESGEMKYIMEDKSLLENFRKQASSLLWSKKEEIAFTTSTTNGINLFANSVKWKRGDNIAIGEIEYPSNIYPWIRIAEMRGLEIRKVKAKNGILKESDFEKAVDDRTRVLPVSLVQFSNGQRMNLRHLSEICEEHGTMLFLDSIQALGAIKVKAHDFNVAGISAGGYKWLCGPLGSGLLYVSDSIREELEPEMISWFGLEKKQQISLWNRVLSGGDLIDERVQISTNAHAFEHSLDNYVELVGLTESLKFLGTIGIENIERRIFKLTDYFIERIEQEKLKLKTPKERDRRSGILAFSSGTKNFSSKEVKRTEKELGKIKIVVRMNAFRSATHFFNSKEDVDSAISAISKILKLRSR